ncbi:MAG TPA: hypothetical protein PKJ30_15050 [Leptospiraceae bacterium]|nr:hypothetical protein [Leptospiraceae bacterium]HNL02430.1 hypothetical protein [Leptospiraceae bacterium]
MLQVGAIILSFEEAGDLTALTPWKAVDVWSLRDVLGDLVLGFVPVSTCNRVEFYYTADTDCHSQILDRVISFLPPLANGITPSHQTGRSAARHLIRLASGLESMVLGETEIRAQLKQAYEDAVKHNTLDRRLRILFQHVFQESRGIRQEVPMSRLPLSVATIATRHMLRLIAPQTEYLKEASLPHTAVVIGSGPMSRQSAESLSRHFQSIVLVNRTVSKIEPLAARLGASVLSFEEFVAAPERVCEGGKFPAAIVTATSRDDAFLTPELVNRILKQRGGSEKLCIVDMALPADVHPDCATDERVSIITMETIRKELDGNREKRAEAARMAADAIEKALIRTEAAMISGVSSTLLKDIQKEVRDKSRQELDALLGNRLSHLSAKDIRMLYDWAIRAHKEMNRIHRKGLESVLEHYYGSENGAPLAERAE